MKGQTLAGRSSEGFSSGIGVVSQNGGSPTVENTTPVEVGIGPSVLGTLSFFKEGLGKF